MTSLLRTYVAGPMRGIEQFNFPSFDLAADRLTAAGHVPINPAEHDRSNGFDPVAMSGNEDLAGLGFSLRDALAWDLEQITKCDAIFLLYGWENSSGAKAEYALAQALGLKIASEEMWDDTRANNTWLRGSAFATGYGLPHERAFTATVHEPRFEVKNTHAKKDEEVRVTSATGGEKGQKLAQLGAVDPVALLEVARVAGFGATKYERYNFMKGYDWSLSFDAMQRHLLLFWSGQDYDDESDLPHLAHAAWHCLALLAFADKGLGTDDRYRKPELREEQ